MLRYHYMLMQQINIRINIKIVATFKPSLSTWIIQSRTHKQKKAQEEENSGGNSNRISSSNQIECSIRQSYQNKGKLRG